MRVGDNLPRFLQILAFVFLIIGIAVHMVFAVSQLWGWSPLIGWGSSFVLLNIAWMHRQAVRALFNGRGQLFEKLYASYLLVGTYVGLLVNIVFAFKVS